MSRWYKWLVAGYTATALLSLSFLATVMLGCQAPVTPTGQTAQTATHLFTNTEVAADNNDCMLPTSSTPSVTTAPPSPPASVQPTTPATEPAVEMTPSNTTAPNTETVPSETVPEATEATATEDTTPQLGQDGYYTDIIKP